MENKIYMMSGSSLVSFAGTHPKIGSESFLASGAHIIGDVECGESCSFWFNTVVRGDCNYIRIGSRTNVQDGSVIHVTNKTAPTLIGNDVTIGHNTTIHGCTIKDLCLIGMGAVILDHVEIGDHCFVAAGSVLTQGKVFEPGSMIMGAPAKVVRPLKPEELKFLETSRDNYLGYMKPYKESLRK